MKVSYCSKTDLGLKHPINSDALGDKKTKNGHVFVVADGSPVDANGSFASRLAVQSILDFFEREIFDNVFIGINHAFQFANEQLYRASILEEGLKGVFASVALVLIRDEGVYHAHIGNSRVYLKSEGKLKRLTTDHGYLDVQLYPSNDVDYSKPVVKLPKALGNTPSISPSVCQAKLDVAAGDVLIVCTHGITKTLDDQTINNKVEYANINSNILELVDVSKGKSAPENITLQLIAVTEGNIQKRLIPAASVKQNSIVDSTTTESQVTQEQSSLFKKNSLGKNKTIKFGSLIIAVFLLIWFVFRQPHDDTDKVLDDAGEIITKDTTNQHQDLEELMEYEKPKKAEKEEEVEEEDLEVIEEETTDVEPTDETEIEEPSTPKEELANTKATEKKEEKKKEEKKEEKDTKKEEKKKEEKKEEKKEKSGKNKSHTVKSGDTINGLATKYGVKPEAIRKANNLTDDKIEIGQQLTIPQ